MARHLARASIGSRHKIPLQPVDRSACSYSADAGLGSDTLSGLSRWRAALLGTAAAGALWLGAPRSAYALCEPSGLNTVTCTGDESDGIDGAVGGDDFDGATTDTLVIQNLTADITPVSGGPTGGDGVIFSTGAGTQNVVINSDLGSHVIEAFDDGFVVNATGNVTIDHTGDVTTQTGTGFLIHSNAGAVDMTTSGEIDADSEAFFVGADGAVGLYHTGDIGSNAGDGIFIDAGGNVTVDVDGNIDAGNDGIEVDAYGDITLDNIGEIDTYNGDGINAASVYGNIEIDNDGDIDAAHDGIFAGARGDDGSGDVDIELSGDIHAGTDGIYAFANNGSVTVKNLAGNIYAGSDGIQVLAEHLVDIDHEGNIEAGGDGIFARGGLGVDIRVNGNILASRGIFARALGGDADIDVTGDIEASSGEGIFVRAYNGAVDVTLDGDIQADDDGIYADAEQGTAKVDSKGNIFAGGAGIDVFGYDGVEIDHEGNIDAANERGIEANSQTGPIDILVEGDILANDDGINAQTRGVGQAIDIDITGDVVSEENFGIYAASGFFDADGGDVNVTIDGDVTTLDDEHDAVRARSFDSGSLLNEPGDITVNIKGGTIRGTADSVNIRDGLDNRLINRGTIVNDFATTEWMAVRGGTGNETVDNYFDILGNVDLGEGVNRFNNWEESFFASGEIVNLDSNDNILWNRGTVSPGDKDNIVTTVLTGSFDQAALAPGTMEMDVDFENGTSDVLAVSGDAAVGGFVQPRVHNIDSFGGGPATFTILATGGTLTDPGFIAAFGTPVVSAHAEVTDGADGFVELVIDGIDFTAPGSSGLSDNEQNIGGYLNDLLGDPAFDPATDPDEEGIETYMDFLANLLTDEDLAKGLDRLSPSVYGLTSQTVALSGLNFTEGLLSCPTDGGSASGADVFIREGKCFWMRASGRSLDVDGQDSASTYDEQAAAISGGVQMEINPGLYAAFGLGYEYSQLDTDSGADAEGDIGHVGAALKWISGIFQLGGTVYGGVAQYDTSRDMGPAGTVDGSADLGFLGGRIRAAAVLGNDTAYIKPLVDLDVIGVHRDGTDEDGDTGLGLSVDGETDTVYSVAPALEIGGQIVIANGVMRPFVRGGARFFWNDDFSATASFLNTDADGSMTVQNGLDDVVGEVSAGFDVLMATATSVRLSYDGRFSDDIQQHGASVKLRQGF